MNNKVGINATRENILLAHKTLRGATNRARRDSANVQPRDHPLS